MAFIEFVFFAGPQVHSKTGLCTNGTFHLVWMTVRVSHLYLNSLRYIPTARMGPPLAAAMTLAFALAAVELILGSK